MEGIRKCLKAPVTTLGRSRQSDNGVQPGHNGAFAGGVNDKKAKIYRLITLLSWG
jgi:hypothetical protein